MNFKVFDLQGVEEYLLIDEYWYCVVYICKEISWYGLMRIDDDGL